MACVTRGVFDHLVEGTHIAWARWGKGVKVRSGAPVVGVQLLTCSGLHRTTGMFLNVCHCCHCLLQEVQEAILDELMDEWEPPAAAPAAAAAAPSAAAPAQPSQPAAAAGAGVSQPQGRRLSSKGAGGLAGLAASSGRGTAGGSGSKRGMRGELACSSHAITAHVLGFMLLCTLLKQVAEEVSGPALQLKHVVTQLPGAQHLSFWWLRECLHYLHMTWLCL